MNSLQNFVISVSCFASFSAFAQEPNSEPASAPTSMPVKEPTSTPMEKPAEPRPMMDDGKIKLSFSGFVAAQIVFDSNSAVGQNHLVSVAGDGDGGRLGFAFDATRLNLVARASAGRVELEGRAEADMENAIFFRIRHAYGAATKDNVTLLLGQTDTLVGNMVGPNLFNNDWFFAQGNAYDRTQQLRVSYAAEKFSLAVAAVPNLYSAVSAAPHLQARFSVHAGKALFGVGAHFGTTDGVANSADATQTVDGVGSFLVAADAALPLGHLSLSLQGWVSSGGAHGTGGHAIGNPLFVVDANGAPVSVPSAGGFLDALFAVNEKVSAGVAAGGSFITDAAPGGVNVPIESNLTAGAYASVAVKPSWKFAFEVQGARTLTALDPATPELRQNVDDLRLLFGQKLSF
jgi:hypothetical protein